VTDVIVIGAGVNGLVAGAALAKQKLSVAILDQQAVVGGAATTAELAPGYRVPAFTHALGPVHSDVIRGLGLDRAGLEFLTPNAALTAFSADGRALVFHRDGVLTAAAIHPFSAGDAGRWMEFKGTIRRVSGLIARLDRHAPPSMDAGGQRDWWHLLALGNHARTLGSRHLAQLARWLPMSVADLTGEWFDSDVVRAALAAHAIFGNPAGPRSAGTGGMLIHRIAADPMLAGSGVTVRGGPGALAAALGERASQLGATVRTGARVARIATADGRVTGVLLENGDMLPARAVVAATSPQHALLNLLPPTDLPPTFLHRVRHIRSRGVTAKVNFALDVLPPFTALAGDAVPLAGRLLIAPDLDYLERAFDATKYGAMSERPWLEIAIPSITDASLAPAGGHVMSIHVHFAPRHLRGTTWADARAALAASVLRVLEPHVPSLSRHIVARDVLTPEDMEQRLGMWGGHIFHGESTLDQMWAARPLLGWAEYRTPVAGLYLASAGTHPGGGLTGLSGWLASQAVARDLQKRVV